jgi:hypothetical protein
VTGELLVAKMGTSFDYETSWRCPFMFFFLIAVPTKLPLRS